MKLKEYTKGKNYNFSKLRVNSVFIKFLRNLFKASNCSKCKGGKLKYIGDDWTGNTWLSVYQCNNCKTEFV